MSRHSATDIVGSVADVTATTTSTLLVDGNTNRNYFFIQNKSATETLVVKYKAAHSGSEGIRLSPGQSFEPKVAPRDSVYIVCLSGTATVSWLEGNGI